MTDDQIKDELGAMYHDGQKPETAAVLGRAIELGASSALVHYILFESGFQEEEFQLAFLMNEESWRVFGREAFSEVIKKIAKNHPTRVIELISSIEARVGHAAVYDTLVVVAYSLAFIRSDEQLKLVDGLPRDLKERIALQVHLDWRTIPWVVRVLKARANNWSDQTSYRYKRLLFRTEWPLSVPVGLRWAMLGGEEYHFPGDKIPPIEDDFSGLPGHEGTLTWWQQLRRSAEDAGWRFVKLTEHMVRGEKLLLAEVNHGVRGIAKVVYTHDNTGARGDRLKAGDEVMVIARPNETEIPVNHIHDRRKLVYEQRGREIWVARHELHPVARPTAVMLAAPEPFFRGKDIPLTPKKR
jgi:hypothetical protein